MSELSQLLEQINLQSSYESTALAIRLKHLLNRIAELEHENGVLKNRLNMNERVGLNDWW